ncbi:MAG: hypothetical protein BGO45_09565 [Microbacterium sp. 71-36]|uniref:DUF2087 domain-containing protein n=1 Tax=unclassified Microbacterium TaxID=2609290 RepID=UPI000868F8FA|nr:MULTISPECIES: DUF2087 domain-containing protein [unclassified Microbacterium]MBN9211964.1 DUF2087 domain-containing protein [Microbacterium sp.]ODT38887.1 MAG: hypothetical protein ABS60_08750 [Microbacterium sp. SCN 71-17]OJV77056.1 MAG: hypothetical protein BGO45_09565 [Microbacterium sp. 71-36]
MNENAWRAILAALSDDAAREVYARVVLGERLDAAVAALAPARARRVTTALTSAGLIAETPDGYAVSATVFADALAAAPRPARATGVDRFFTEGRLTGYPSRAGDRREVLAAVASRILVDDERLTEREINERLAAIVDDVAAIRRYLVDEGLIERTRSGTEYALARP